MAGASAILGWADAALECFVDPRASRETLVIRHYGVVRDRLQRQFHLGFERMAGGNNHAVVPCVVLERGQLLDML